MVLNKNLYSLLRMKWGAVKVINAGIERLESRDADGHYQVAHRGEHYNVCCPLCGDERFRLSISYCYLSNTLGGSYRNKTLAQCYNESCDVTSDEFVGPLIDDLELIEAGLMEVSDVYTPPADLPASGSYAIRMPSGLVSLRELSPQHPALQFLQFKYPRVPLASFIAANASYAQERDPLCYPAYNRIIFPIVYEGEVVAWQGRSIDPTETIRWFLPSGFQKTVYNYDRVSEIDVPVLCEGITTSIACGSVGIAIFGKTITNKLLQQMRSKWGSIIIATDPDTFVPDFRGNLGGKVAVTSIVDTLAPHMRLRMIQWPEVVLELARRNNKGESVTVPDAADLGPTFMAKLIEEAV